MEFPALENNRLLNAAKGLSVDMVPVWIMRQAGRYLPEFRKERENSDFFTMCETPEIACKVTLQPVERFPLDAAIIFSDILVIPKALGMQVLMTPEGPVLPNPLTHPDSLKTLHFEKKKLQCVFDAVTLTRHKLGGRVPLIGFAGAPWTVMTYMIEGKGSKTMSIAKKWLYVHTEDSHKLLQTITDATVEYLVGQVEAGAQMLQIFESHAEHLGPASFREFCLPYLKQICDRVKERATLLNVGEVPMTVFPKGGHYALAELADLNFDVIGIDWTVDPKEARRLVGPNKVLQGNLDPCVLYGPTGCIRKAVKEMIDAFGHEKYIANLGHGIYPDMDPEHVGIFVEAVHSYMNTEA